MSEPVTTWRVGRTFAEAKANETDEPFEKWLDLFYQWLDKEARRAYAKGVQEGIRVETRRPRKLHVAAMEADQ